jgi:hypothetical protein
MAQRLSAEQHRALTVLADAGHKGCTDERMMTYGFEFDVLAKLVRARLATAILRNVRIDGRMIEVALLRITDTGTQALSN